MLAKRADILLDVAIDKSWFMMIVKMVFVFVFVFAVVVRARVLVKEDVRCWCNRKCAGRKALVVRKARRCSIVNVDNSFVGFIHSFRF